MSELDFDHFIRLLQEEKEGLLKFMAQEGMGKHASLRDSTEELSMIDNHPADMGSELFERSKDLSLHELRLRTLQDINMALERIADGSFGLCLSCGHQIEKERLEALPYARYCVNCKKLREEQGKEEGDERPVEELVLYPPFQRSFMDGKDYTGYDGEDAWQEVARYGTADSPQDVPGDPDNPAFVESEENIGIVDRMDKFPSTRKNWREKENEKEEDNTGGRKRS
jgi:YteA family regulatory protein